MFVDNQMRDHSCQVWRHVALPVLALLVCAHLLPAGADEQNRRVAMRQPSSPTPEQKEDSWRHLQEPVELPSLPCYTGNAHFVMGIIYPNTRGGPNIGLRYSTAEDGDTVLQWYKDTLRTYRWNVVSPRQGFTNVTASLAGNTVSVRIMPRSRPDSRCDFYIMYHMGRPM